jgi:hypothetical protein
MRRLLEVIFLGKPMNSNPGFMEKNCMQYPQGFFINDIFTANHEK